MPLLRKRRSSKDQNSPPRPGIFSRWSSKDKLKDTPTNNYPPLTPELEKSYHLLRLKGHEQTVPPPHQYIEARGHEDHQDVQTRLEHLSIESTPSSPPPTRPTFTRAATTPPPRPRQELTHRSPPIPRFPTTAPPPTHKRPYRTHLLHLLLAEHYFDTLLLPLSIHEFSLLPATPSILFNLGQLHLFIHAHSTAYTYFHSAVSLDPWFLPAWMQLGYLHFLARRYGEAEEAWREALRCFRGGREVAWEQLGLMWTGKVEEVVWNRAAADGRRRGVRPACVGFGAIFRVPGRWARGVRVEVGEGTEWGFKGRGRIVGERESVYVMRR